MFSSLMMTGCGELKNLLQVALTVRKKRKNSQHMKKRLRKKWSEMRKKNTVDNLLKIHLAWLDAVSQQHYLGKKSYIYKCPECNVFISDKLARHLENKHQYTATDAKFSQSKMRVLYIWCINDKHGKHLPLPCEPCSE